MRYKYLLWRIWLVPPYALVNMLSLSSRAGEPMRKNANKHISTSKKAVHLPFFLMKCANEGRLSFLQHLPWSICFDSLWLDGGKTFYANYLLHCVHHANGASKDDERRQVCHVLPGCHLRKELPFWRQYFTNRPVLPRGIDSMFCGNQLFSSVCVSTSRGKCLATSNWRHGSQN